MRDGVAAGYGILTVENEAQALVRASPDTAKGGRDKGGEAVRACLALIELKRRFAGNRPAMQRRSGADRTGAESGRRSAAAQHRPACGGPGALSAGAEPGARPRRGDRRVSAPPARPRDRRRQLRRGRREAVRRHRARRRRASRAARRNAVGRAQRGMAAAAARKAAAADPRSGRLRAGAPIRHPAARHDQRICRDRLCVLQRSRAGAGERRLRPPRAHAAGGGSASARDGDASASSAASGAFSRRWPGRAGWASRTTRR